MSQNNNPIPPTISQSELDPVIGREVLGPFKRLLAYHVKEAKECVRVSEIMIRDYISDPEKEPSENDVKLLESFVDSLQEHRNLMEAILTLVEDKIYSPNVLASSRRQALANEVKALLEHAKYPITVSDLSKTFELYKQVFASKGLQMVVSPQGSIRTATDHESAEEGDESKKGSSTVSPRTLNSTNAKVVYDVPDYPDRSIDLEYPNELEAKAAAMVAQGNTKARVIGQSNPIPTVRSNDSVVSIENTISKRVVPQRIQKISEHTAAPKHSSANSIYATPIKAHEPKHQLPSDQLKSDQIITPELMADILYNIERRQVEKERESERAKDQLLQEVAFLRKENHSLRLKAEKSGRNPVEPEEPLRYTPNPEKVKRSPKPEIQPESKNILFTSSNESDEEASHDEQATSQYDSDSEYRHATGHDIQYQSKHKVGKREAPRNRTSRQKKVRIDEVRKSLISINDNGSFTDFQTIVIKDIKIKTAKAVFGENKIQGSNELSEPKAVPTQYTNPQSHQNSQHPQQKKGTKVKGNYQSQNSGQKGNANKAIEALYEPAKLQPKWNLVAWSFPFNVPEQGQKCGACEGQHNMIRCPLTSNEFRKQLQEKNRCERCAIQGHNAAQCQKWYTCGYCHGDHVMGACPMKEFFRKRENIPSFCVIKDENSPKKTFFRRHGKTSSQ